MARITFEITDNWGKKGEVTFDRDGLEASVEVNLQFAICWEDKTKLMESLEKLIQDLKI